MDRSEGEEKCRLTGSWFGFQVPRRRGGVEAGRGRRRRPGKGDEKVLFIAKVYLSVAWPVRNINNYSYRGPRMRVSMTI